MVAVGQIISGRYEVERRLGEGGLATVWQVRHLQLGSLHALKVLHLRKPMLVERLLREGRIQATTRHPHIVSVTDVVHHEDQVGLVLEYVDGLPLDLWQLRHGPLDVPRALEILTPVLTALATAHAAAVLHRDLKPSNILMARMGRGWMPKVTDFGIAKLVEGALNPIDTLAGVTLGTPGYIPPEQLLDASRVDARADVFALGVVTYECLTGRRAFPSLAGRAPDLTVGPAALFDVKPDLPLHLADAVHRAMALDPDERFADVHEFGEALLAAWPALLAQLRSAPTSNSGMPMPDVAPTMRLGIDAASTTLPSDGAAERRFVPVDQGAWLSHAPSQARSAEPEPITAPGDRPATQSDEVPVVFDADAPTDLYPMSPPADELPPATSPVSAPPTVPSAAVPAPANRRISPTLVAAAALFAGAVGMWMATPPNTTAPLGPREQVTKVPQVPRTSPRGTARDEAPVRPAAAPPVASVVADVVVRAVEAAPDLPPASPPPAVRVARSATEPSSRAAPPAAPPDVIGNVRVASAPSTPDAAAVPSTSIRVISTSQAPVRVAGSAAAPSIAAPAVAAPIRVANPAPSTTTSPTVWRAAPAQQPAQTVEATPLGAWSGQAADDKMLIDVKLRQGDQIIADLVLSNGYGSQRHEVRGTVQSTTLRLASDDGMLQLTGHLDTTNARGLLRGLDGESARAWSATWSGRR